MDAVTVDDQQVIAPPSRRQNRSGEELAMRDLIVPELRKQYPGARIVHEMPLRYSSNRLDLAAITRSEIVAVEIKSSKDVADRLEAQLRSFGPVCSKIIVGLAPRWNEQLPLREEKHPGHTSYIRQLTPAQEIIDAVRQRFSWIETWTVDAEAQAVTVTDNCYRPNPWPWPGEMLHILRVAELRAVADFHRVAARSVHLDLVRACAEMMTGREIAAAVCAALRARDGFGELSDPPICS